MKPCVLRPAYETYSHTFEVSLYSHNPMSYEAESYFRYFIDELGQDIVFKVNLVKYGLFEAIGIDGLDFPDIYVDMRSYYEPLCDTCSKDIKTYEMILFGTQICDYNGYLLAKMAYENADSFWPCILNGR